MSTGAEKGKSAMMQDALGHVDGGFSTLFGPKGHLVLLQSDLLESVYSTSDCAEILEYVR